MSISDSIVQEKACAATGSDDRVQFPEIIDGKINTEKFLQAARDVVRTVGAYSFSTLTSNCPWRRTPAERDPVLNAT